MPQPGSKSYDDQKSHIRHDLEQEGVTDEAAAEKADEAMDAAADPAGRKRVSSKDSGSGTRQGDPWPDRPDRAQSGI